MNGDKGFSYPAALLMVVVISISLLTAQKQWSTVMRREKEKQLLYRGGQIAQAIESYYNETIKGTRQYPERLVDLLKDDRFAVIKRHIRRVDKDPMTVKGEWGIIYDGRGKIKGVFSRSAEEPIKKDGFPEIYGHFKNKNKYSDWKFIYEKK